MKKNFAIIFINIFFISCIDIIINDDFYESVNLQGSGWIEFYQNNPEINRVFNNNYSVQVWFSGDENSGDEAECILNIFDENNNISIYKNPNMINHLMIYINDIFFDQIEIDELNLSDKHNFVLLSLVKENDFLRLYINDTFILNECIVPINNSSTCEVNGYVWNETTNHCIYATSSSVDCSNKGACSNNQFNNNQEDCINEGSCTNPIYDNQNDCINSFMCSDISYDNEQDCNNADAIWGPSSWNSTNIWNSSNLIWDSKINLQFENAQVSIGSNTTLDNNYSNFWYGYIDEIRIWDIALSNDNILFHNEYPNKIVESYDSLEFNHINGIWDFKINVEQENIPYKFQDKNDDNEFIIIYNQGNQNNELSKIGR